MLLCRKIIAGLLVILIFAFFYSFLPARIFPPPSPKPPPILSKETKVVGRVGGYMIESLSGWTSPFAEVILTSQGLARKTIADTNGFFSFYFVPAPQNLGELCLVSQDVNQLPSFPNCLAPPPTNRSLAIKDVLLPPTILLENNKIPAGKTTKASGMTIPNSEVQVYFFSEKRFSITAIIRKIPPLSFIPKPVFAVGLPKYAIKSNQNGYFEFSLPATSPAFNRVYAAAILPETILRSPKSNTLAFEAIGLLGIIKMFLKIFLEQAAAFFGALRTNPLRIILLELLILGGLVCSMLARKLR